MWKYFSLSYLIIHNVNDIELIYPKTSDEVFIAVSLHKWYRWHVVTFCHTFAPTGSGCKRSALAWAPWFGNAWRKCGLLAVNIDVLWPIVFWLYHNYAWSLHWHLFTTVCWGQVYLTTGKDLMHRSIDDNKFVYLVKKITETMSPQESC